MTPTKSVRIKITGYVQGVGFRAFVQAQAIGWDVAGWIRNRADGSLEGQFVGAAAAVDALCEMCRRGPPGARVDHVETVSEPPPDGVFGFTILPTS